MDMNFVETVYRHFNPYDARSGTESIAPLLYSLARVGRFETVTEFGTGFTTPFIAKALADNHRDYLEHRKSLQERVGRSRPALVELLQSEALTQSALDEGSLGDIFKAVWNIIHADAPPVTPNPFFYAQRHEPHLFTWEKLEESSDYVATLRAALEDLGLSRYVTVTCGAEIEGYMDAIPAIRRPVGMAWNDFGNKLKFFEETYSHVTSQGGIMIFHSPFDFPEDMASIKQRVSDEPCELLTLQEPHKFAQNGCFLIRRCQTSYKDPRITYADPRLALRESIESLLDLSAQQS